MRDEFTAAAKDLLAHRVAFRCSNPQCRQPTSGPQANPEGKVNIGVAAHITAASTGGPRFDPALSADERSGQNNGVWLCQSCAKLVDNDPSRFSVPVIREWRERAESAAARDLEQRLRRFPDSATTFERLEKLLPALLDEMRSDLAVSPLKREFILLKRMWAYNSDPQNVPLAYFYDDHQDLLDKVRLLESEGLVQDIAFNDVKRYRISERLADYLGAP